MGRPFIEFIQSQWLDWHEPVAQSRYSFWEKTLSLDAETGAATRLTWLPPSWGADVCHLQAAEEFLVLAGGMLVNGIEYGHLGYGFLPARSSRRKWQTVSGAIVLSYTNAPPVLVAGPGDGDPAEAQLVVDPYRSDWVELDVIRPNMAPGARKLPLRTDAETGEATWLLGGAPVRKGRFAERHPVTEETFVIDGWSIGPRGKMGRGAYFCRPPAEWHGPFGTPASGKLNIVRSIGGPLATEYDTDHPQELDWDPRYDPILPPELVDAAERGLKADGDPLIGHVRPVWQDT